MIYRIVLERVVLYSSDLTPGRFKNPCIAESNDDVWHQKRGGRYYNENLHIFLAHEQQWKR